MLYFDCNQYYIQSTFIEINEGGYILEINKNKIRELMNNYCNGNYTAFARALNLNVAHVYRTLNNSSSKAGGKFLGAIISFCEKHKLNYKEYIFLK